MAGPVADIRRDPTAHRLADIAEAAVLMASLVEDIHRGPPAADLTADPAEVVGHAAAVAADLAEAAALAEVAAEAHVGPHRTAVAAALTSRAKGRAARLFRCTSCQSLRNALANTNKPQFFRSVSASIGIRFRHQPSAGISHVHGYLLAGLQRG